MTGDCSKLLVAGDRDGAVGVVDVLLNQVHNVAILDGIVAIVKSISAILHRAMTDAHLTADVKEKFLGCCSFVEHSVMFERQLAHVTVELVIPNFWQPLDLFVKVSDPILVVYNFFGEKQLLRRRLLVEGVIIG